MAASAQKFGPAVPKQGPIRPTPLPKVRLQGSSSRRPRARAQAQCWRHMEDCQRREHAQRRRWQHEDPAPASVRAGRARALRRLGKVPLPVIANAEDDECAELGPVAAEGAARALVHGPRPPPLSPL